MIAGEFLCYDRAGMELVGVTDGGVCLWDGTIEQQANADMLIDIFEQTGQLQELKDWI